MRPLVAVGVLGVLCATTQAQASGLGDRILKANDELFHKGNLAYVEDAFTPGYTVHADGQSTPVGPHGIRDFVTAMRAAFPDLRVEIEVLVEDDDKVAWLRTHRGTFETDCLGVKATGKPMMWQTLIVTRHEDGKIAEEWAVSNFGEQAEKE
jgi:predicted ester cyclase